MAKSKEQAPEPLEKRKPGRPKKRGPGRPPNSEVFSEVTEKEIEQRIELFMLLLMPDVDAARAYYKKKRPKDIKNVSDIGLIAGLHKARVLEFSRMVTDSITWLRKRNLQVPISKKEQLELTRRARAYFSEKGKHTETEILFGDDDV